VLYCRLNTGSSIMPQIQRSQVESVKLRCRFEMTAADAPSSDEFCAFEFPGCERCPKVLPTVRTVGSSEDPMKSTVWRGWINGFWRESITESFVDRKNLALFKKNVSQSRTTTRSAKCF
jgi:hypothetical protein